MSLRARLVATMGGLLVAAFAVTFLAVYRVTGHDQRARIERSLAAGMSALGRAGVPASARTAGELAAAARSFEAVQPFGPATRLLYATLPGGRTVTNENELLGLVREPGEPAETPLAQAAEGRAARGILTAPEGYSTVTVPDVGAIRLLVRRVRRVPGEVRLGVGEALAPVRDAQDDVAHAFLLFGALGLVAALALGALLSGRVLAPLRRIAAAAARVDAGAQERLSGGAGDPAEVRVLAEALDHMVARLGDALDRQRAFAADASHELRTPLTAIRGQLEVLALAHDPSAQEVARVEAMVRRELERMEHLVDDLLLLARSDEEPERRREAVDLAALAGDAVRRSPSVERRFELRTHDGATVAGDAQALQRALANLVANAVAHTAAGGLVRVTVERHGARVVLAVEDDGDGVPVAHRERIFERFHRVDPGRARIEGGAGLGLAIVRAIAESHGGGVFAEESPEGGARIGLDLPRGPGAAHL